MKMKLNNASIALEVRTNQGPARINAVVSLDSTASTTPWTCTSVWRLNRFYQCRRISVITLKRCCIFPRSIKIKCFFSLKFWIYTSFKGGRVGESDEINKNKFFFFFLYLKFWIYSTILRVPWVSRMMCRLVIRAPWDLGSNLMVSTVPPPR